MPRYYFHTDGHVDDHGLELSGDAEARSQALRYAGQQISFQQSLGVSGEFNMTITDERGSRLFGLKLSATEWSCNPPE